MTNTVDALNHLTLFVRDAAGRLQYQTNANNEVLQFTYNPADEILALTDGKNQSTHWNYSEYGLMTNKLDQSNTEILRYTYDPVGRLTNRWSAAKGNTKYSFDAVGNLLTINYPLSGTINYSYDPLNRLTNMIDASGTNAFTYSDSGQLLTEDGPFANDTITSVYWSRMRTNLSLLQPTGVWTNAFGYDSDNRLNSVISPAGTFAYYYDEPSTRLTNVALPSGAYVNNVYDTMSRLTNSFLYNTSQLPLDGHVYQYDAENQRTNEVRADSSTVNYKYDNIGQLTVATSSVPAEIRGYTYDAAWNVNYRTNNGSLSTFIVDNKNQLTNFSLARNVYDSTGNMVTNNNNHNVLVYDDENQLVRYFHYLNNPITISSGDTRTDFIYDGLGRLRKRIEWVVSCTAGQGAVQGAGAVPNSGGGGGGGNNCTWGEVSETWYVYDGMRVIQERDSNNVPTVSYTRGNDLSVSLEDAGGIGGLLARSSGYSSGNWTSHADYYADANGNITSLIDGNQSVVASYRYDPFGNIISKSGSIADANVYRFSSKEVHVNSGMYYYGFRFYDPNLQRWINRDPIHEFGGLNLYSFVWNRAAAFVDFFGLSGCHVWDIYDDKDPNPVVADINREANERADRKAQGEWDKEAAAGRALAGIAASSAAGVIVGLVASASVLAAAPLGVSYLVLAGMSQTAAAGTMTTGLAITAGIGATATGYNIYNDARAGNWNGVAFDFGTLTGGAICGVGGGGRALTELSGKPSSVPLGAGLFGDKGLGYSRNFPDGSVAKWLGSAPTPQSGGGALTSLAGGAGALINAAPTSGGIPINNAQQFENNYRSLPGKWQ